ncbi:MAG: hypothetical protein A2V88_04795 [Elusimicrobia bacterium RBG_16_66_12]|nr:MAG: hypothetical protein A2V88_04795 [Elusimicrobia bacterium RBG_16_66_12]
MSKTIEKIIVANSQIDLVLTDQFLAYLREYLIPSKVVDLGTLHRAPHKALPWLISTYRKVRSSFIGVIISETTQQNIVFVFRKTGVRRYELNLITLDTQADLQTLKPDDYLIRMSDKTRSFNGRLAYEIGPDIYALPTSFEGGDPYGLIQAHLVRDIVVHRGEFAPGWCGTFHTADDAVFCAAEVEPSGTFHIDCALWMSGAVFQTVRVREDDETRKDPAYVKTMRGVMREFDQFAVDLEHAQKFINDLTAAWRAIRELESAYHVGEMGDWDSVMNHAKTRYPAIAVTGWVGSGSECAMTKYGRDWWRMIVYWRLYHLMGYLLSPCLPMKVAWKIDQYVLRRRCLLEFYDTWTFRLRIIFYGRWADLCYGKEPAR